MKRRSFLRCLVAGVAVSGVPATARAAVESFAQSRPFCQLMRLWLSTCGCVMNRRGSIKRGRARWLT